VREGVPLIVIQRQLSHSNLGITSVYLQGIDNAEIIETSTPAASPWSRSTHPCRADESRPDAARRAERKRSTERRHSEARAERLAAPVVAAVEGAIVLSRAERHPGRGSRSPPSSKT
jgi:hypothetical protein